MGYDPKDIFFVSAIPCTAKKFEVGRADQSAAGVPDVDVAITTREVGRMIESAGINFRALEDEKFDTPFDISSGAGVIFGATGGVMEAALRYAGGDRFLGKKIGKSSSPRYAARKASSSRLTILKERKSTSQSHPARRTRRSSFAGVQSGEYERSVHRDHGLPGGCVNGGGQPYQPAAVRNSVDLRAVRAKVLYNDDAQRDLRKSQDNAGVKKLYDEFFGAPGSHKAHEVLIRVTSREECNFPNIKKSARGADFFV
jgi:NADP-reducing hydrogenase subunit HndD